MAEPMLETYLFISSKQPKIERDKIFEEFRYSGHNKNCVLRVPSLRKAVERIPPQSVLRIGSVDCCGSFDELLELLVLLERKDCVLQSSNEPWLNETIRDCAYCIGKMRSVVERYKK